MKEKTRRRGTKKKKALCSSFLLDFLEALVFSRSRYVNKGLETPGRLRRLINQPPSVTRLNETSLV